MYLCVCGLKVCRVVFPCVAAVCQETVWEAFKIFWDELPERAVYQGWVGRCMDGSVSVADIGRFFSQSEEHAALIRNVGSPLVELDDGVIDCLEECYRNVKSYDIDARWR